MNETIVKAPSVKMEKLQDLFIEMTSSNCNLRCKYCFKDLKEKKLKDYIPYETVMNALNVIDKNELEYIHLTGAEPMLHNDFNKIIRLCLKYASVVVHTNAFSINDKKARFLRKVEEENNRGNEIIFIIGIDSTDEKTNDEMKGRGSFRKAVHAIESLVKYEFNPILSIVNYKNIDENELKNNFKKMCEALNIEMTDINFKILPLINKDEYKEISEDIDFEKVNTECSRGRTLTINGVFTCPLLANDNRGKCGMDFINYSNVNYLETQYCSQCAGNKNSLFLIEM